MLLTIITIGAVNASEDIADDNVTAIEPTGDLTVSEVDDDNVIQTVDDEINGAEDSEEILSDDEVFEPEVIFLIQDIILIFLDKKNLHKIPNFYHYHELYDTLASKLAENIKIESSTNVIVDRSKSKHEDMRIFNERFSSSLNNPNNYHVNINHVNSIKEKGLQIADLIAWSTFQSLEHDNSEFIDLFKNKNIFEVFNDVKNRNLKTEEPTAN